VDSWREVPAGPLALAERCIYKRRTLDAEGFCRMASASRYLSIPLPNGSRISVLLSLPFALIHIASLLIFFIPFHWYYLVACLGLLVVRMFFVTTSRPRHAT